MSGSASLFSESTAASSRKRASYPAVAQSADPAAASQPQPLLHSAAIPQLKKVRKDLLPNHAFRGDARARALAGPAGPVFQRWSDLSPAQRCFSDGLAMAFSFLSLAELVCAAAVCKVWLTASKIANIAPATLNNPSIGSSPDLLRCRLGSSPFRRHVHAITHHPARVGASGANEVAQTVWTIRGVAELASLPQLRHISRLRISTAGSGCPTTAGAECAEFSFPPLLESADLHFKHAQPLISASNINHSSTGSVQLRCVLRALRPCRSLTALSLTLHGSIELALDGLLEVTSLRTLAIDIQRANMSGVGLCRFTEAQIGVVKQLSGLHRLTLLDWDHGWQVGNPLQTGWLRWLCAPPHRLQQLLELDLSQHYLHLEHMQLLQQLPALTALEPAGIDETALPLLPAFAPRLRFLKVAFTLWSEDDDLDPKLFEERTGFARGPLLLPALTPCAALVQLALRECVFAEAETTALCLALPLLRGLDLTDVGWPSLEPLRHLPQLRSFSLHQTFRCFPRLQPTTAHVASLTSLQRLTLVHALAQPLTAALQDLITALRPPSALLPALCEFCYEA